MKDKRSLVFLFVCFLAIVIRIRFNSDGSIINNDSINLGDQSYLSGDVDGNGKVASMDYIMVRKHLLKQTLLTGDKLKRADVNNDGKVSSLDYIAIRKTIINGVVAPTATPKPTNTPKPTATPTPKPTATPTPKPTATPTPKPTATPTPKPTATPTPKPTATPTPKPTNTPAPAIPAGSCYYKESSTWRYCWGTESSCGSGYKSVNVKYEDCVNACYCQNNGVECGVWAKMGWSGYSLLSPQPANEEDCHVPATEAKSKSLLSGFTLKKEYNSDTFKYWVEYSNSQAASVGSSDIYISHIWMKDPRKQIKVALAGGTTFGNKMPRDIMANEVNRLGLSSKGLLAVNASFFYDSNVPGWGTYQSTYVIIHEGKWLRDDADKDFGSGKAIYSAMGLTKYGTLNYYGMAPGEKVASRNRMRVEGVKYSTAAVASVKSNNAESKQLHRTMVCQIDWNNYAVITANGISGISAANVAYNKLGCKKLIQLDGGGSITLLYKDKSNSIISSTIVSDRYMSDMLYFVEQ